MKEIKNLYQFRGSPKDDGWYYFISSSKLRKPIVDLPTSEGNWNNKFFFVGGNWRQVISTSREEINVTSRCCVTMSAVELTESAHVSFVRCFCYQG